jgi:hypothetical protein
MVDFAAALGASKAASTLLVLFIPSRDRADEAIDFSARERRADKAFRSQAAWG